MTDLQVINEPCFCGRTKVTRECAENWREDLQAAKLHQTGEFGANLGSQTHNEVIVFDAVAADDQLTEYDAMGVRDIEVRRRQFQVVEWPSDEFSLQVAGDFKELKKTVAVRMVDIDKARVNGRYIQFLEQAFEWQLLSCFLYPHFWSIPSCWVDLMNRNDRTDPFLTSFLQAGSVRVLVAVTPAYGDAVLHCLATGEPWEDGPSPAIGDPLFIPLYEELKRQQDDLARSAPAARPRRKK